MELNTTATAVPSLPIFFPAEESYSGNYQRSSELNPVWLLGRPPACCPSLFS